MLIDCHAHLYDYSDEEVGEILKRGRSVNVGAVISAGTTLASTKRCISLSRSHPDVFVGVGIHPMEVLEPFTDATYETLKEMALSSSKVLVMSEIGLDFLDGAPDRAIQYDAFRQQIRLARELELPIVFHSRESHDEVFRVLKEEQAYEVGGAMHYFQGDIKEARTAIDLGFYISFARPLLRLSDLQKVASELSLGDIVLETDAAPQPFKTKRENWTEPRHLAVIAEKLAEIKDVSMYEIENVTTGNMKNLLGRRWNELKSEVENNILDV